LSTELAVLADALVLLARAEDKSGQIIANLGTSLVRIALLGNANSFEVICLKKYSYRLVTNTIKLVHKNNPQGGNSQQFLGKFV
jgi:hypothetical protein